MKRNVYVLIGVLTILLMVLNACGAATVAPTEVPKVETPQPQAPTATTAAPAAKPLAGQKLTVLLEDAPWHHEIEKTAPAWADKMGIQLVMDYLPEVQEREKMNLDLTTGTGLYDVFLTDEMYIAKVAKLGALEPLDPYVKRDSLDLTDFPPLGLQTLTHDGGLYGIPWRTAMNMLFYRKDLTDKYGIKIPTSYDELMTAAVAVQEKLRADGVTDVYGMTARGLRGEGLNMWIVGSSVLPAWGAKWFDANGKVKVNSPEFVAAADYYATLLKKAGPPNSAAMSWDDCSKFFEAGKAVFYIDSAIQLSLMKDRGSDVAKNSEAAPIPTGPLGTHHSGLYVPAYVMAKNSKVKDAAWEFIKFATSYDQMLMDAVQGDNFEIGRASVVKSAEFANRFPYPSLNEAQVATMAWAREERPMVVDWPQMGDSVGAAVQAVIAGDKTAQEALDQAQQELAP